MSKKPTETPFQIRQGDVFLTRIADIPGGAVPADERTGRGLILQHGEVTGHAHRIPHPHRSASMYRDEMGARYMRVTAPVPLLHEEHKTRCDACAIQGLGFQIATHYEAGGEPMPESRRYSCDKHTGPHAEQLEQPGATVVLPGVYRVNIHAEYVPGELPRSVVD